MIPLLKSKAFYTAEELDVLALKFSELMTNETFSVAELQGYLLTNKLDPRGAVDNLSKWMKDQEGERARMKQRRREY